MSVPGFLENLGEYHVVGFPFAVDAYAEIQLKLRGREYLLDVLKCGNSNLFR